MRFRAETRDLLSRTRAAAEPLKSPSPPNGAGPFTVGFVCTANICRSAYAEAAFTALTAADPRMRATSAGLQAATGTPMDPMMTEQLLDRHPGAPVGHHSRAVDDAFIAECDLVLVMTARHRTLLLRRHPMALPETFLLTEFVSLLPALTGERATPRDLVRQAHRLRAQAADTADVPDPHRRAPDVYAEVAMTLDRLVAGLVRGLR